MQSQIAHLQDALAAGDRTGAQKAWRGGGGYFYAPPGASHGGGWVGAGLFANT